MAIQDENNVSQDEENDDWMSKLLHSHIFKNIPFQEIQKIFLLFEQIDVAKNDKIIQQGEAGDYYYIVNKGRFRVSRKIPNQKKEFKLADLHEGNGFGEEAIIGNVPRNASVKALTNGKLTRIKKDDFISLIKDKILNTVSYDETKDMVKQGAICLDTRFKDEFEQATLKLKRCQNLPLNTLRIEIDKLDKEKVYITYCDNGARSAIAAFLLMERGLNVSHLEGGIERLLPSDNEDKETGNKESEDKNEQHDQKAHEESQNNMSGNNVNQMLEEQKNILSKLNLGQDGEMNELSKVLNAVISNIYNQLEQALKEKAEVEVEKRIIEEKLQNVLSKDKNK